MQLAMNLLGIVVVIGLCWLLSWHRRDVNWRLVGKALAIQFLLAIFIVKVPVGQQVIAVLSDGVTAVVNSGKDGVAFVFGDLADSSKGFIFVVQALANIIFVSGLVELLYYLGVIGFVVKKLGWVVRKLIGSTETESFIATANMFLGQTSSPVLISRYIGHMTRSEILVILVAGMGSILISKIILPEVETAESLDELAIDGKGSNSSPIEAVINGASVGVTIVIGISASLIAIIGLVALLNMILGFAGLSLEIIFGYIFAPFGYLMGFDGAAALQEGTLLGQKIALNEFVAFSNLGSFIGTLDARTAMMASISLAGFANVGSMAICVGGIGALCPGKKGVLSQLVLRGMIGGALLSILSAMLCGLVALF
ncbi:NupC/NupG family nucleoside CNT transporter [Veillonellaceae bacterium WCA-693-APC-5D-A]|uniref:NupC/NupG family nucleoside CNT transporter n=1 Tax=Anaerovibrio slackiae TaxID=2652309 RepID=A0A6I2UE36_9FIRM|nr:nucleoside transporter C-terminal domain-containing protein [Anaerovibrio slackiae]MSU08967.1 NupC/NupG family nucleoside CNT transporter [Anaerovibrio slackiae]